MTYSIKKKFDPPASPGFLWSGAGLVSSGSFLKNAGVPSNSTGLIVSVNDGELKEVFLTCKANTSCTIEIVKRSGASFVSFSPAATVSLSAARSTTASFSGISLNLGDELACKVISGSATDLIVGGQIKRS